MKTKYQRSFLNKKDGEFSVIPFAGQPLIISNELFPEFVGFLHNLHVSVGAISRKTVSVIAIGNGVLSLRSLEKWQTTVAMLSSLSHGHKMYRNCLIGLKNIELQQRKR